MSNRSQPRPIPKRAPVATSSASDDGPIKMSTSVDGKKSFVPTTASQAPTTAGGERKVSSQLEDEMDDSLTKKNLKHVELENNNSMDESSSSSKGPLFQSTDAYRQLQTQKDELMDCLRKSENKYVVYNVEAKYVKYRRIIVDWMCEVGEEYQLQALTIHMAVRYLDRILCGVTVQKNRLQLVAMCCILVAAKYEERDDRVPSIDDLNECSNSAYTPALIRDMEVMVLNQLQWGLDAVTPVHFLSYYLDEGIVFEDDIVDGKAFSKRAARYVKKYADFFSDLCLQEHAFQQYPPSIISAAVIAASRRAVKIDPIWRPQLVLLTKYREKHIYSCYKHIYNHYETSFPTVPQPAVSPKAVVDFEANAFKS